MSASVEILQRQLQQYPERTELYRDLVRALLRRGRAGEAGNVVLEMEQHVPGSPMARLLAKEVLAHRVERAQLEPSPGPRGDLAAELRAEIEALWSERHMGDGTAALARIRALRRQYLDDREADASLRLLRAAIQEFRGQIHDALSTYNEAVEHSRKKPRIAHALLQKGRLMQRVRYVDKAVAHYRQVFKYEPANMAAVGALLRCGVEVEEELSDRWLEAVVRLDGRSPFEALRESTV